MWNFGQPLRGIVQIANIVEDIEAEMERLVRELGIGPWFLLEHFEFEWLRYRGEPSSPDLTLALAYSGSMMFELIQQNDAGPSVYREVRERRGWGFHHWAITTPPEEYDETLEGYRARGHDIVLEGAVAVGGRAAYVEVEGLAGMIEIIECTPKVETLFTSLQQAGVGWDGSEPIRRIG